MGTGATLRTALKWLMAGALTVSVVLPCAGQTSEHRALWAFAWGPGFKNSAEVANLITRAKLANCNTVVAQVRKSGDAYYFPTRPNRDVRPADIASDYDPLLDLCTQGHEQGIQIYAWVVAERIASAAPSNPEHLMNLHPDWLTESLSGGTFFTGEGYYSDPGHPGAAEWNFNVAIDLIRHYPIDGLVFDYIRYPLQNSGYNDTALARFRARYGHPSTYTPNYTDALWSAWRREQLTHFVRKVYANALEIRPEVVIGASSIGDRSDAYSAKFQDWRSWMLGGILDCNYPMIYTATNSTFISRVGDAVANGGSRFTYALQGSYMNTISNTMTQLGLARSNGAKGVGVYRYCYTYSGDTDTNADNEPDFYSTLISQTFAQPVTPPTMPWKTNPTTGHVKGVIIDPLLGIGMDAAWVSVSPAGGGGGYGTYSDGTGFYAYLNLAPGNYNVTVSKGTFMQTKPVTITVGHIETVDFLVSGSEAESIPGAKQLPDGMGVSLPPMTVTAGNAQLLNKFYIEDAQHSAGIMVELPESTDVLVYPGDRVKVYGTLGTAANGERRIVNPIVYTLDTDGPQVDTLGVRGMDLAATSQGNPDSGVDMNLVGLLVETVGCVTAVDTTAKCFYVDDGSRTADGSGAIGVRVKYSELAEGNEIATPQVNARVRVKGIGSVESIAGALRCVVLVRGQSDIVPDSGTSLQAPADTILPGWSLISIPGTPREPTPGAVFGSIPIDNSLLGWNNRTQGPLVYDAWSAETFGDIMRASGYWLMAQESHPLSVTVYGGGSSDFLISMPAAGWTLLGNPSQSPIPWADALVSNGLEVEPMFTASHTRGWLNSMGFWWDASTQGLYDFGLAEDYVSCNTLEPWHGYWVQTHTDSLYLLIR